MSKWTELWRDFVRDTSYKHVLRDRKISNDQFWESYEVYDQILCYAGYPGEVLERISSFIPSGSVLLDIGAGTGAFALPLSRNTKRTLAVDPSAYQLKLLMEKARQAGLTNISPIEKGWMDVSSDELYDVDYSLAAYSLFEEDIEAFLRKMLNVSGKGVFIVFRGGGVDPLSEFAYGKRREADYFCLYSILEEMGYRFEVEMFARDYALPINLVIRQHRFAQREPDEIIEFFRSQERLQEREGRDWATFSLKDALLYLIR